MHETIPLTNNPTLVLFTQTPTEQTRHQHRLLNAATLRSKRLTSGELHRSKARGTDTQSGPEYNSFRTHRRKLEKSLLTNSLSKNSHRRPSPLEQPSPPNQTSPLRAFSTPHSPLCAHRHSPCHAFWFVYTAIGCPRHFGSASDFVHGNIYWLISNSAQKSHISIQLWSQWRNGSALDFYRIHQATVIQRLRVRAPPEMLFAFCIFLPFFCACTG
jgi:hypothetical protein